MKMQLQPNRWSCLPTSFAMVIDRPFADVIKALGHDGSEMIFPDLVEPKGRRSFHIQELISVAWDVGFTTTPFEPHPQAIHDGDGLYSRGVSFPKGNVLRMLELLKDHSGVLTGLSKHGTHHSVAWDNVSERIYNPIGEIETLNTFSIQAFWCVVRR